MKLLFVLLGLLSLALAKSFKSVIITFPKGTPSNVIDEAKGGVITHEYHLINGFAAEAPVTCLETISAQSSEYNPTIEEDQIVSANGK
ncbi:hypothetical protein N7481_006479 [Penicillium waksmanii]|uniref:uncharacterized protein n=1 Tax=Penicillium waksmanii TaxID=69791 RepID=UPI002547691F|nr:uncharacterized protein N7481_006479 [Penicillium waksmanii]KAJ5984380.1 hypothetical protein N7481_006479 [Penicillium waksmanii]